MSTGMVVTLAGSAGQAGLESAARTEQAQTGPATQNLPQTGALKSFEGFLKTAGHVVGVLLSDVVKYALPIASVVSVVASPLPGAEQAFVASLTLVLNAVVVIEQRWASLGSAADAEKLADVLAIVEQPIILLFAQSGFAVDSAYVTGLINAIVALLNAQPAVPFPLTAAS